MLPVTFLGVFIACFAGEITCDVLPQSTKNCNDNDFHEPGYAPGCKYHCTTGNEGENHIQWEAYKNATVCVEFKDDDDTKLDHVGVCFSGVCLDHIKRCPGCTESELEQRWSSLPELNKEFHRCETRNQSSPVENCLYVCKESYYFDSHNFVKIGYFYGIYEDGNLCKLEGDNTGVCRSGLCYRTDVISPQS
uniref:Putative basic tail protein n=1 Tax=Ixodes ricinus TaxID=34613 RepID=A0A0K8RIC2_IXORI